MVKRFFSILFLITIFPALSLTQIYVSPAGSDSGDGSIGNPYRTIQKAISVVTAGGLIYLRDGIYYNSTTIQPSISGLADQHIKLWAYPGETPILDFSSQSYSSSSRGVYLSSDYWYLKGLTIRYAGDNGLYITGDHHIVVSCTFYKNKDTGLQISGGGSYNVVINCDSYDNYDSLTHGENADGFAPKLNLGPGNEFHGCRAWNNSDDGWDMYEAQNGVLIDSCWSFHNGYNIWGDTNFQGDGNGIKVGGNYVPATSLITHSITFDNRSKGFDQNHNTAGQILYNNTAWRNGGNNFAFAEAPTTGKDTMINNVSASGNISVNGSAVQTTNSWQGFTVSNADFLSLDTSLAHAPRNSDGSLPETDLLRLASGSDLVNAGTDVGFPYNGSGPDLGAFESGSVVLTFTITASAGSNGQIVPSGTVTIEAGNDTTFNFIPDTGYHIDSVIIDEVYIGQASSHTFSNVQENHTIRVTFSVNIYTITATAGSNGQITPSGEIMVPYGTDTTFNFTSDTGFHVDSIVVDDVFIGQAASHTFIDVGENHTIRVTFLINRYTLTVNAVNGSVVKVPDETAFDHGSSIQMTAIPDAGFNFSGWSGDAGGSENPLTVIMNSDKNITAHFGEDSVVFTVNEGWNMISVPSISDNPQKDFLFPTAQTAAFAFEGTYVQRDTLERVVGYWLRFGQDENIKFWGTPNLNDTINVSVGWNMIGALSVPVPVSGIASDPPGMVTSDFLTYYGDYVVSDTLQPGKGYWVKVTEPGMLILAGGGKQLAQNRIRIEPTSEIPPPPPGREDNIESYSVSSNYLCQNYPNPFNPTTKMSFVISQTSFVTLRVYDLLGKEIAALVNDIKQPGEYNVQWNADGVQSGMYFYRLNVGDFTQTRKLIILK